MSFLPVPQALRTLLCLTLLLALNAPIHAGNDGAGSDAQTYAGVRVTPGDRGKLPSQPVPSGMVASDAEWQLFGPVFMDKDPGRFAPWYEGRTEPFVLDAARQIPDSIALDGVRETAKPLNTGAGLVDFQQMYFMNAGHGMVYLMRNEQASAASMLQVKAYAVGWLKVWCNGELVHQDGTNDYAGKLHAFAIPLQAGSNVICMRVASASGGWITQRAGFWTKDWKATEDQSLGSWLLQLWRAEQPLAAPTLSTTSAEWNNQGQPLRWEANGFTTFESQGGTTLTLASAPWQTARAQGQLADPGAGDRLYKFRITARALADADSEWFMTLKQGIELGFVCHQAPELDRYEVIWQVRRDGRPVHEAERYVMKDWMPDFIPASLPRFSPFETILKGIPIPQAETSTHSMQVIVSLRGDELVMWVDAMQLSIRTRVEGMAARAGTPVISARGIVADLADFEMHPLPTELRDRLAMIDNPPIRWTAQHPDLTKEAAGYPKMEGLTPVTLFTARPERWLQNHHPMVGFGAGKLIAAWSNAYLYEDTAGLRVMAAISDDGTSWTEAFELFPSLGQGADHDFPHRKGLSVYPSGPNPMVAEREGRIYVFASTNNSTMRYLCRRVYADNTLGPICWFRGEPSPDDVRQLPTVDQVDDAQLRADEPWLRAWLDHEERYSPARGGIPEAADYGEISHDPIYYCTDGTQMRVWRNYNGTHRIYVSYRKQEGEPWSLGIPTNIPDSPSGVAVGSLPNGSVFLLGNQISGKLDDPDMRPYREYFSNWSGYETQPEHLNRDPLTLALSTDGYTFDRVWAIRWNCPRSRFWGDGLGFAYPSAVIAHDRLWVLYSVNKQDVEIIGIPLARLQD